MSRNNDYTPYPWSFIPALVHQTSNVSFNAIRDGRYLITREIYNNVVIIIVTNLVGWYLAIHFLCNYCVVDIIKRQLACEDLKQNHPIGVHITWQGRWLSSQDLYNDRINSYIAVKVAWSSGLDILLWEAIPSKVPTEWYMTKHIASLIIEICNICISLVNPLKSLAYKTIYSIAKGGFGHLVLELVWRTTNIYNDRKTIFQSHIALLGQTEWQVAELAYHKEQG